MQLSRLEKYRSRRQPAEGAELKDGETKDKDEFGTMSKVSLLDQHSELKKKAEGTRYRFSCVIRWLEIELVHMMSSRDAKVYEVNLKTVTFELAVPCLASKGAG